MLNAMYVKSQAIWREHVLRMKEECTPMEADASSAVISIARLVANGRWHRSPQTEMSPERRD
jgi:hypothetical protein